MAMADPEERRGLSIGQRIGICTAGMAVAGIAAACVVFLTVHPVSRAVLGLKFLLFCLISDLVCLGYLAWLRARLRRWQVGAPPKA